MPFSARLARRACLFVSLVACVATPLVAQGEVNVDLLAGVLAAEDARTFNQPVLEQALNQADTLVRARAALAIGRIGDPAGLSMLLPLLEQPEANLTPAVLFAIGLLRDSSAVAPIIRRLGTAPALDVPSTVEAVTALARIGGPQAAEFLGSVLEGRATLEVTDTLAVQEQAALEAWRLGNLIPATALLSLLSAEGTGLRWKAVYSLTRQRNAAAIAGQRISTMTGDRDGIVRQFVVRALSASYAEAAGITRETAAGLAKPLVGDQDPGVRINALRALGTLKVESSVPAVVSRLNDPFGNVEVQATQTLGDIGGPEAVAALTRQLDPRRPFAVRREALLALAKADTAALRKAMDPWIKSNDWRLRMIAGEAAAQAWRGAGVKPFLSDRDGKVVNGALAAWAGAVTGPDPELAAAARPLLGHADGMVRATAASAVARVPSVGDVSALVSAYRQSARDSFPDAAQGALEALAAIHKTEAGRSAVETGFIAAFPTSDNYLLRAWAEANWPALAERWGAVHPVSTGRSPVDYRELVRRFVLPTGQDYRARVTVEVEGKGSFQLQLFGTDAPLTSANFLRLVDRRFFDNNRWHRVVPNFVVQDGDPRGDGNGGPGGAIRDELNRRRYDGFVLGMALAGPDTGGSQWFITLSPQPHLDGTYTVFGLVTSGEGTVQRVLQGDVIRSIHR